MSAMITLTRILAVTLIFVFTVSYTVALTRFQLQCKQWHNHYRLMHQVKRVRYSTDLEKRAIKWANVLAKNNQFEHERQNAGNLYATRTKQRNPCRVAVTAFYSEEKYYNYKKPGWSAKTAHFTQVVWKSTQYIGAAWVQRRDKMWVLVVKYRPLGNDGRYAQNVFPRTITTAKPTLTTRAAVGYKSTAGLTTGLMSTINTTMNLNGTNTTAVGVIRAGAVPVGFSLSCCSAGVMAGVFLIYFI